jgi:hypothetical protein
MCYCVKYYFIFRPILRHPVLQYISVVLYYDDEADVGGYDFNYFIPSAESRRL